MWEENDAKRDCKSTQFLALYFQMLTLHFVVEQSHIIRGASLHLTPHKSNNVIILQGHHSSDWCWSDWNYWIELHILTNLWGVEAMPGLLKFALWSQMSFHMSTLKSIEIEAILQNDKVSQCHDKVKGKRMLLQSSVFWRFF